MSEAPHDSTVEPAFNQDFVKDVASLDRGLPGRLRKEVMDTQTDLPPRPPPRNPVDSINGKERLRRDLNMNARKSVFTPASFKNYTGLDLLDNGQSKTIPDISGSGLKLASQFLLGTPAGPSFRDQGDEKNNLGDPYAQIMRTVIVPHDLYNNHNVFRNASLQANVEQYAWVFGECTMFGGLQHLRHVQALNWAWSQKKMPYGQFRNLMASGEITKAFWPRTQAGSGAHDDRHEFEYPHFPEMDERRHWTFEPYKAMGYVGSGAIVDGSGNNIQTALHTRGLFRSMPNYWNICAFKPQQGAHAYWIVTVRVEASERRAEQVETEQKNGQPFYIMDNEIVSLVMEPAVAPYGKVIPKAWYDNELVRGCCFYAGQFHGVTSRTRMEKAEAATRKVLFPSVDGTTGTQSCIEGMDMLTMQINLAGY